METVKSNLVPMANIEEVRARELYLLNKQRRKDKAISLNLLEKHEMKYPLQFNKLCINIAFDRTSGSNYAKEIMKIDKIGLRDVSEVVLNYLNCRKSRVTNSFLNALPDKVSKIIFDNFSQHRFKRFSHYAKSFVRLLPSVTRVVSIVGWVISSGHLKAIFVSASNAEEIRFVKCSISTDKLDFQAKRRACTKTVTFIDCGKEKYSNWKNYSDKFWPVLKAISHNRHFESLERMELLDNSIPLDRLKEMIEKYYKLIQSQTSDQAQFLCEFNPENQSLVKKSKGIFFKVYDEEIHCYEEFQPK